eukprot:GFUD01103359.1.p1 GENE.GFUD01103359.1~~GFUD01103359.1.p1  ORF type:complete len:413 (-),score=56.89 GFUD01103359.1:81-1319(-)
MDQESFVMQACDLMEDIIHANSTQQDLNAAIESLLDDSDDSDEAMDDLLLLSEVRKLTQIDDEAFLLEKLSLLFQQVRVSTTILRPYHQHFVTPDGCNRVTWSNFESKYPVGIFQRLFRFKQEHVAVLIRALKIPESMSFEGYMTSGIEALLLMLRRLSSLCRYADLLPQFQSQVFNGLCVFLFKKIGPHIRRIDHEWFTDRSKLELWSAAMLEKGCPLQNTIGWGDGTHIPVCKPIQGQRPWYCGHHKTHCFKALVLTSVSGLMLGFGPFDGSTHDSLAADIVGLDDLLMEHLSFDDGTHFNLFLDAGYRVGHSMITPYRRRRDMTPDELEWNRRMCRDRVAVEWSIGKIKTLFKMLTYKKNLKALLSPVATYFFLAMHLTNLHTILYGCEVAQYFNVDVEPLESYLRGFR